MKTKRHYYLMISFDADFKDLSLKDFKKDSFQIDNFDKLAKNSGLYFAYKVIKKHKGSISCSYINPHKSYIKIKLPLNIK